MVRSTETFDPVPAMDPVPCAVIEYDRLPVALIATDSGFPPMRPEKENAAPEEPLPEEVSSNKPAGNVAE